MQITIDGATFDVRDEGRGPAVVLLHGFPLAKESWDAQARHLANFARVIRFDLRGLGTTTATPGPYLMESLAGDAIEILDALGIERATIVGHSLGGYVTFAFFRMFAERCAGLGFICTRAGADDDASVAFRRKLATAAEAEGMQPVIDAFLPRFFTPEFSGAQASEVASVREMLQRTDPRGAAAMLRGMAERVDSRDLLAEIEVPVLVVAGAHDAMIAATESQAIGECGRGDEIATLDCGHIPQIESANELNAALERLVRRVMA